MLPCCMLLHLSNFLDYATGFDLYSLLRPNPQINEGLDSEWSQFCHSIRLVLRPQWLEKVDIYFTSLEKGNPEVSVKVKDIS